MERQETLSFLFFSLRVVSFDSRPLPFFLYFNLNLIKAIKRKDNVWVPRYDTCLYFVPSLDFSLSSLF